MTRFTGPHPRRGASAPPAVLVELGKQLLGELQNRIRMGGPPTLRLFREIEAGSVEAKMVAGNPQVFYTVKGGRETFITTSGIITWPAESVAARAGTFHPQEAFIPPPRERAGTWGHFRYSPDTLGRGGAIDWRNDDESIVVSWHGPPNRYFQNTGGNPYRRDLFCNGKVVFTLDDPNLPGEVNAGGTFTIRGAAVRDDALILVITSGSPNIDRVIRAHWHDGKPSAEDTEVLGQRTNSFEEWETQFYHPWLFNQGGTEARCLRGFSPEEELDQYLREVTLTVNGDAVGFASADTLNPITTRTTTTTTEHAQQVVHATREVGLFAKPTSGELAGMAVGDTLDKPLIPMPIDEYANVGPGGAGCVSSETIATVDEVDGDLWLKCGVDYRDGAPVYLERRIATSETASSGTVTTTASLSDSFTTSAATYTKTLGGYTVAGTAERIRSFSRSSSSTLESTFEATTGGFRFNGRTVLASSTVTTTATAGWTYAQNDAYDESVMGFVDNYDDDHFQSAGWFDGNAAEAAFPDPIDTGQTVTFSGERVIESNDATLALLFADLRIGFAAFVKATLASTVTETFSGDQESPADAVSAVATETTKSAEWSHESASTTALGANAWESDASSSGTETIARPMQQPARLLKYATGTTVTLPSFATSTYYDLSAGPPLYAGGDDGASAPDICLALEFAAPTPETTEVESSLTIRAAIAPPFGSDLNSLWALRLGPWSGWDEDEVFQEDGDGVRCYGSWQHLRGHLVYSQVAGEHDTGNFKFAAGTSGPAISSLNPREPVGGPPALYHPMFIHTALRPQRFVAGA